MRKAKTLGLCGTALAGLALLIAPHGCSKEPKVQYLPVGQTIEVKPSSVNGQPTGLALGDPPATVRGTVLSWYFGTEQEAFGYDEGRKTNPMVTLFDKNGKALYGPTEWSEIKQLFHNCSDLVEFVRMAHEAIACGGGFPSPYAVARAEATQTVVENGVTETETRTAVNFTVVPYPAPNGDVVMWNASFY